MSAKLHARAALALLWLVSALLGSSPLLAQDAPTQPAEPPPAESPSSTPSAPPASPTPASPTPAPSGPAPAEPSQDTPTPPTDTLDPSELEGVPVPELPADEYEDDDTVELDATLEDRDASTDDEERPRVVIRYFLERVEVRGNTTRASVVKRYVPLEIGEPFDVDDPTIERIRWRLLGTGYFDDVKLSLRRGTQKGWVVLVIEVDERNTLVIDRFVAGVSRVVTRSTTTDDELAPYVGVGISESNLFGLGLGVTAAGVITDHQFGVDLGYLDTSVGGTGFSLSGRIFYNDAREFFGRNPLVALSCPTPLPLDEDEAEEDACRSEREGKRAVVAYDRFGFGFGTGHDIAGNLRYTIDWLGEYVDVQSKPAAASTSRGTEIVPIDFRIENGQSLVSSLRFGLIFDRRDHPALTTRGTVASFYARVGSGLLGSSYDFVRIEGRVRHFIPLPWHHVLSVGGFLGTVFGQPPFFYEFYAADLSDLLPSRLLELNLDHRRPLDLLGTSIAEMDMEELAGRIDFEYQLPLHRGGGLVRGVDAYAGAGVYLLSRREDLRLSIPGYEGFSRIPIDLTFDLGVQADTEIGVVRLGFSSFIGFLPDWGQ